MGPGGKLGGVLLTKVGPGEPLGVAEPLWGMWVPKTPTPLPGPGGLAAAAHTGKVRRWCPVSPCCCVPTAAHPPSDPRQSLLGAGWEAGPGGCPPALTPLLLPSPGIYVCAKCGHELFSSRAKYEHSSPWPAFTETVHEDSVAKRKERPGALKVLIQKPLGSSKKKNKPKPHRLFFTSLPAQKDRLLTNPLLAFLGVLWQVWQRARP